MDNTATTTGAPLTRRQAREIERRTGVRPVARIGGSIDETGRIERNEITALVSVLPTSLVERLSETSSAPTADIPSAFDGRALTVRAARPASLVAARRRRAVGGFAAAASAAALASAGVAGLGAQADVTAAHEANLVTAAHAADASTVDALDSAAPEQTSDTAVAAPVVVDETNSSVVALGANLVQSAAAEAPAPVVAASPSTKAPSGSGGGGGGSITVASGPLQQMILDAAKAQIGSAPQDCTDLVQNALAAAGIGQRRDSGGGDLGIESFLRYGYKISVDEAQPGDLLVLPGTHIAVYAGGGQAVHGGWNGDADNTVLAGLHYSYAYAIRVTG